MRSVLSIKCSLAINIWGSFSVIRNMSMSRKQKTHNKCSVNICRLEIPPIVLSPFLSLMHWEKDTGLCHPRHRHHKYPDSASVESNFLFPHGLGLTTSARLNTKLIWRKTELTTSTFASPGHKARASMGSWYKANHNNSPVVAFRPLLCGPLSP